MAAALGLALGGCGARNDEDLGASASPEAGAHDATAEAPVLDANVVDRTNADAGVPEVTDGAVPARDAPGLDGTAEADAEAAPPVFWEGCGDAGGQTGACAPQGLACDGGCVAIGPQHCGACDSRCPSAMPLCVAGADAGTHACAAACPSSAPTDCNGVCVDLLTDGHNCGACGHDCQGGTCGGDPTAPFVPDPVGGHCKPMVLASIFGGAAAGGIAVDSANVYWTNPGDGTPGTGMVMKCAVGGCNNQPTILASGLDGPARIAVDCTNAYWTSAGDGTLVRCAVGGCNNQPTVLASGGVMDVAVDGTNVYWTAGAPSMVMKCAVGGCNNQPTILASGAGRIAVDPVNVYWMDGSSTLKCAVGGCNNQPVVVASGSKPGGSDIAANPTNAYWIAPGGTTMYGWIASSPTAGSYNVITVLGSWPGVSGLAVDSTSVYWGTEGFSAYSGAIEKCADNCVNGPSTGVTATLLGRAPDQIALGFRSVYWTEVGAPLLDGGPFEGPAEAIVAKIAK